MREQARDHVLGRATRRSTAIDVERRPGLDPPKIVEQSVAGAGVASDQLLATDIGEFATPPMLRTAIGEPRCSSHQRAVKYRRQRRPLAASRDIGGAKIIDDRSAKTPGRRRFAKLAGARAGL